MVYSEVIEANALPLSQVATHTQDSVSKAVLIFIGKDEWPNCHSLIPLIVLHLGSYMLECNHKFHR